MLSRPWDWKNVTPLPEQPERPGRTRLSQSKEKAILFAKAKSNAEILEGWQPKNRAGVERLINGVNLSPAELHAELTVVLQSGGSDLARVESVPALRSELVKHEDYRWKTMAGLTPHAEALAKAGFYCDLNGHVQCFFCRGMVTELMDADDYHQFHSDTCRFLRGDVCENFAANPLLRSQTEQATGHIQTTTHRSVHESLVCILCESNPVSALFLPCHHVNSCYSCGVQWHQCPSCNRAIVTTVPMTWRDFQEINP